MRIVSRLEFLKMPSGTLFQECEHEWGFGDMQIKYDSLIFHDDGDGDFVCMKFTEIDADSSEELFRRIEEMAESGASYPLDLEATQRDGCLIRSAKYLVYERHDVVALRDFFVKLVDEAA